MGHGNFDFGFVSTQDLATLLFTYKTVLPSTMTFMAYTTRSFGFLWESMRAVGSTGVIHECTDIRKGVFGGKEAT
jgi:hypothetical protein